jgi:signal transduction histidine kinase
VTAARRRPLSSIGVKLALAYLVPTALLWGTLSLLTYRTSSRELGGELARRLSSLAASTATQVRGRYLTELGPGDEQERAFQNTQRKLEAVRVATGASRITVFAKDGTALCDTGSAHIGDKLYQLELDQTELDRMFAQHVPVSSTLFRGSDGRLYQAGYAEVTASEEDPQVVAGLSVEAPAEYFDRLETLQGRLKLYAALALALYVVITLVVAALIVRPTRRLAAAAERIGRGELDTPVPSRGHDEIALLARTLDEMREALRARSERLQMMLAGIAHEVRNPLGGIELYAGILRDELTSDDEKLGHVKKIEREVGHLKNVVSDFLEYARRPRPELRATELGPLVGEVVEICAADAQAADVKLVADTPAGLAAPIDASQLRRALLNLIRNALQATPAGGTVTVAATTDGARVRVSVSDTGKGIPSDSMEKIFQPFFTTKEKGTGLGLAFVREIVHDHGAKLDVTSEVGRGTTFSFHLPRAGA